MAEESSTKLVELQDIELDTTVSGEVLSDERLRLESGHDSLTPSDLLKSPTTADEDSETSNDDEDPEDHNAINYKVWNVGVLRSIAS